MERTYYEQYYEYERKHWWFIARSKILSDYIRTNIELDGGSRILNIGAATGSSTEMLREFGEVTSIEYDEECIQQTADLLDFDIHQGDILDLEFPDNSIDLVCAFDVIEHVEDHRLAVSEMLRVCKPGGSLLVTVPALMSLWGEHDVINHHFRRYNRKELSELFSDFSNCEIAYLTYFNSRLFPAIFLVRSLSRLRKSRAEDLRSDCEKYDFGPLDQVFLKVFSGESGRISRQKPSLIPGVSLLAHLTKTR